MIHLLVRWLIILANIGGAAFGFFIYYGEQLAATNPLLWAFVPDCPTFSLLFAVAFYFRGEGRPAVLNRLIGKAGERGVPLPGFLRKGVPDLSFFWFFAFAGALKYGFWTVFVLLTYSGFYFTPAASTMYTILLGGHVVLMFETMLLVGRIRVRRIFLPLVGLSLIVNDLADYLLGTHPPLPAGSLAFMFPATVGMSIAFTLLAYGVLRRFPKESLKA